MEIFRWVEVLLLGAVAVIAYRILAQALDWREHTDVASYIGFGLIILAVSLTIIGIFMARSRKHKRLD